MKDLIQQSVEEALRKVRAGTLFEEESSEDAVEPEDILKTPEEEFQPIEPTGEEQTDELFVPSVDSLKAIDIFKFVNLMNRFRSSPSFSEGDRRIQFDTYWESLKPQERQFVYIAMLGFTQIALEGANAKDSSHPHDYGLDIAPEAAEREEVKPGALPADVSEIPADQFAPIVVGESAGKRRRWQQQAIQKFQKMLG